jgi:hypothetical protein
MAKKTFINSTVDVDFSNQNGEAVSKLRGSLFFI